MRPNVGRETCRRIAPADPDGDAGFTFIKPVVALVAISIVIVTIGVVSVLPGSIPRRLFHDIRNEQCRKGPESHATVALGDSLTRMNSDPGWNFLGTNTWFAIDACDGRMAYGYDAGAYGNTTAQMLARFHADVADHHPKLVIILGGTNDILQDVPAPVTINHLRSLINDSRALGAAVAIGTIPPINAKPFSDAVAPLNARIVALAAATRSTLIDFHAAVANGNQYRTGWTTDGIHPTHSGAEAMASAAAEAVASRH